MSGFSVDWLDLREHADHRARDPGLREQALAWLETRPDGNAGQVIDLGAGTGSTLRALDGGNRAQLNWRLLDLDPALLKEARRRHGASHRLETSLADLSRVDRLPLESARLITASALFDLVSAGFVEALAERLTVQCRQQAVGLYAALNYDGLTQWRPAHPLDAAVLEAFNHDQRTDKGFGPALGPVAADTLAAIFKAAGFSVRRAASPWVLTGADQALVEELITGIANAVLGSPGLDPQALDDWVVFRKARAGSGHCRVGHEDVLILPA